MVSFRSIVPALAAPLIVATGAAMAQTASLPQLVAAKYALTRPSADRTEIVTPGDVVVLQKGNLFMASSASALASNNNYKDGRILQNLFNKSKFSTPPGDAPAISTRTFVAGERLWITDVVLKEDGVILSFLSDTFGIDRYYATLKFAFPKGSNPPSERIMNLIAEVIQVQPAENPVPQQTSAAAAPQPAMAAIPPPPPPADTAIPAPPTIAVGQSKERVVALLGTPQKIVKFSNKEIDYFTDTKVTFVNNKVTHVE